MSILKSIGDFIYAVNALLLNLVMGVWQMITMIPSAMSMLTSSVAYMPTILVAFALGLITISIVFLVVGR